ncbi:hypothetical protein NQ317_007296 [Molorchus minor]|uniref:Myb/SANT-like DNA-binding domain-containing protein n=1 Tax=Molorchus minor TaxID=1323400 RepID=A0ABQ9JV09_9CUCU|nr:hypothetical protein NQ317_007296 [Molorchus minor]
MENYTLRTLGKKRTSNFREDETKLLIQLWGSPQIQNKLYLTHRKAPVMRLLAANMQQRGFYRTPDEIKTRIRNLKCLYHRIKRSTQTGTGIGTVDPDWPHFKAMDEILSKRNQVKQQQNIYKDNVFEGPMCEDIKQEIIDDIDINDDMESFTTNSMNESDAEFEDEAHHMPPLIPAPHISDNSKDSKNDRPDDSLVKIAPKPVKAAPPPPPPPTSNNLQIPIQAGIRNAANGVTPSIPFPLLILNGLPNAATTAAQNAQNCGSAKKGATAGSAFGVGLNNPEFLQETSNHRYPQEPPGSAKGKPGGGKAAAGNGETEDGIREVGQHAVPHPPAHVWRSPPEASLLQPPNDGGGNSSDCDSDLPKKNGGKRPCPDGGLDILKDSKILRNVLEQGIKKYMLEENQSDKDEDSGVQNDENSRGSCK